MTKTNRTSNTISMSARLWPRCNRYSQHKQVRNWLHVRGSSHK